MTSTARPPVSVLICSRDRPRMLAECLATVMAALGPEDDLIVIDSASVEQEAMAKAVESEAGTRARLVRVELPGASRARNAGWRETSHPLALFLDDDVRVDRDWVDAFAAAADRHPDTTFFTGRIDVPPDQAGTTRPVAIKADDEPHVIDFSSVGTLGHSASVMVRREALAAVDGFDELLGAGARYPGSEDADLFDRLLAAGFTGRYEPTARAWHDQWRDKKDLLRLDWRYGVGAGARLRKLVVKRDERVRTRRIAREMVWDYGVRQAARDLRAGWRLGFLLHIAAVAGTATGFINAAITARVDDGHLRLRVRRP